LLLPKQKYDCVTVIRRITTTICRLATVKFPVTKSLLVQQVARSQVAYVV